jgi:hypothetical protein
LGAKYLFPPKFYNVFSGLPFSETEESCHLAPKRRLEQSFSCDSKGLGWRTVQVRPELLRRHPRCDQRGRLPLLYEPLISLLKAYSVASGAIDIS